MLTLSKIIGMAAKGTQKLAESTKKAEAYLGPKIKTAASNASRIRITLKPEPVAKPKK